MTSDRRQTEAARAELRDHVARDHIWRAPVKGCATCSRLLARLDALRVRRDL